jgi:hypothetical protein
MSRPRQAPQPRVAVAAPILAGKRHAAPSAFTPENLLREARRQKGLAAAPVPEVCVLDPDGDMVRWLRTTNRAQHDWAWACYRTDLCRVADGGMRRNTASAWSMSAVVWSAEIWKRVCCEIGA